MKDYLFGSTAGTITTICLLLMIGYMVYLILKRNKIQYWGRHILILIVFGLNICCYAATRDGFHLTVQNAIDGSVAPGIFPLISFPTAIGAIGATMIIVSGIVSIFTRKQTMKQKLCFITMTGIILKIVVIEISRIFF